MSIDDYSLEEVYERLADITNANLAGAIPAWNAGPTLDEMTVLFEKLDVWLKNGDEAPAAWKPPATPEPDYSGYPQTPEEQVFCKHGNHIWFGHECGICMEED
jgi:hypothetical protein